MRMLIDIPNEEKVKIGKFIDQQRRYRFKQLKEAQFKIDPFICGICSKQTYQKLKKEPILESEIYDELLHKLGFEYDYENNNHLDTIEEKLYLYYQDYDFDKAYSYTNEEWLPYLETRKKYPYEYLLWKCLTDDDVDTYLDSFYMLNKKEKEIFSIIILKKVYEDSADKDIPLENLCIHLNVTKIQYLFVLIKQEKFYRASVLCHELLSTDLNAKETILCLIGKLFILNAVEPSSFYKQAQQLINHPKFKECKDTLLVNNVYHVIGLYEYKEHHYDEAWDCFIKVVDNSSFIFPEILMMEHICTLENKELPVHLKHLDLSNQDADYVTLYKYFQYKREKKDYDFLNQYLMDCCAPLIPSSYPTWILKEIIRDEFQWISKQTSKTKYYYQFNRLYK